MWRDSGRGLILAGVAALALAACSEAGDDKSAPGESGSAPAADVAAPTTDAAPTGELAALGDRAAIPVSLPKMAYVFDYGFRLPGKDIAALEQKHADMCEAMGPYGCQIVSLSTTGDQDEEITGKLELAVVSDKARAFGGKLAESAKSAGSEQVSATIEGEDLSKQMVDTDARLKTRIALRDRLLEVLKTRKGTVAELVEAERGVAQVNEEIDQARSWLQEMKGRVSFSRVVVNYESASPAVGSFLAPVRGALGSLGSILGGLVAILIMLAAIGGPLALVFWGFRRARRRWAPVEAG
jgi:hypothetical protein